MIKIEIFGEHQPTPEPEHTVRFEFRRHKSASHDPSVKQLAYLVAVGQLNRFMDSFPVKVDGYNKTFEVRRTAVEALGFTLKMVD